MKGQDGTADQVLSQGEVAGPFLRNITLIVKDIQKAKQFYSGRLGFKILKDYGEYVSMQTAGGVLIGLHTPHDGHTHKVETSGVEFSFLVDDVDRWYERLSKEGVPFSQKPEKTGWGTKEAYFTDPDGHVLTLTSLAEQTPSPA